MFPDIHRSSIIKQAAAIVGTGLFLITFLASPSITHAALTNGANAIDALGQYDDSLTNPQPVYTKGAANNGPTKFGLSDPRGIAIDTVHHRLFVSEQANNRVLVYNLDSSNDLVDHLPDYVLGQPNFSTNTTATTQAGMRLPNGVGYDTVHNRLFVTDFNNRRVLVFDVSALATNMNAAYVLGQATFTSSGAAVTQSGMSGPINAQYDSVHDHLFVADYTNNRYLVFTGATLSNGMNAAYVLGQPNFVTNSAAATSQSRFVRTAAIAFDAARDRVFLADYNHGRIVVFTGSIISNGMSGAYVIGQSNFTNGTAGTTQSRLNSPYDATYDSVRDRLIVSDASNNRILIFTGSIIRNGMSGAYVIGQAGFTTATAATTQAGFNFNAGIAFDSGNNRLYVVDNTNNRVLIFNLSGLSNGMSASDALGQYDTFLADLQPVYTKGGANNGPNALGLNIPVATALDAVHHRLFVSDTLNNRVLVYALTTANTISSYTPANVLGQANLYSATATWSQSGMRRPYGLVYDSATNRLFVAENSNHRILVYDVSSITNGMNASYVLGQANFTASGAATTQARLNGPVGLAYDTVHSRLFVVDNGNNRVMVFSGSSLSNGMSGAYVLGKATFTSASTATTQSGMNQPYGVTYDPSRDRVFVADFNNNRVLIFSGSTLATGMNANAVLGQSLFTTATAGTTQVTLRNPVALAYDSQADRLFVSDYTNNRVLIFNGSAIVTGGNAALVLGQSTFATATAGVTQSSLVAPYGLSIDATNRRVYIASVGSNRLLVFDTSPPITGKLIKSDGTYASSGTIITAALNGTVTASGLTIPGGQFSISGITMTGGTIVSLYTASPTLKSALITMGSGGTMTGINLTQNTLTLRSDSSTTLTSAAINIAASHSNQSLFSSNTTTLTLSGATNLFAPKGAVSINTLTLPSVTQTLSGSLTITNFSRTGSTLIIAPNSNLTISNLNLSNLTLRSAVSGRSFNLSSTNAGISSIAVSDANNTGQNILECSSCTNNGNNSRWNFTTPTTNASSSATTSNGSSGGGGGGGGSTYVPVTSSSSSAAANSSFRSSARSARSSSSNSHFAPTPTPIPNPISLSTILRITNLRKNPTANSTLIATLLKDWKVTIQGFTGMWAKVRTISGKEGYILRKNVSDGNVQSLSSSSAASVQSIPTPTGAHTIVNLNVRISPDINAKVMAQLPKNSPVTIIKTMGDWLQISFEGKTGFVVGKWIKR